MLYFLLVLKPKLHHKLIFLLKNKLTKFSIIFFLCLNLLGLLLVSFVPINYDIKFYKYFDKLEIISVSNVFGEAIKRVVDGKSLS